MRIQEFGTVRKTRYDRNGKPFQTARNIRQVEDMSGRVLRIERSDEQIGERVYDERSRVVQTIASDGEASTHVYDELDQLIAEISPMGHRKDYSFDGEGRLRTVKLPAVHDPNQPDRRSNGQNTPTVTTAMGK